jgi:hypothetical protein
MYQLFYHGEAPPEIPPLPQNGSPESDEWGGSGESAKLFQRLRQLLGRISQADRKLILHMTFQLVRRNTRPNNQPIS